MTRVQPVKPAPEPGIDWSTATKPTSEPESWVATPIAAEPRPPSTVPIGTRIAPYLYLFSTVIFAGVLAIHPVGRFFIAPLILLAVVVAGLFVNALISARHELRALVDDRAVRVTHGLEHGCIGVLREKGYRVHSGVTKTGSFSVFASGISTRKVRKATLEAIKRFSRGDTRLAYSPHCGTSLIVGLTMFAVLVLGCTIGAIVFGIAAGPAFMGAAVLGVIAQLAWRPLGLLAQRMLTVSTQFRRVTVGRVWHGEHHDDRSEVIVPITVTL